MKNTDLKISLSNDYENMHKNEANSMFVIKTDLVYHYFLENDFLITKVIIDNRYSKN